MEALQVENRSCFSSQANFLWLALPLTATLHPEIIEVIVILITYNLLPVDGDVEGAAVLLQLHLLLLHLVLLPRLASLVGHQGVGDVDHLWYVLSKKGLELDKKRKRVNWKDLSHRSINLGVLVFLFRMKPNKHKLKSRFTKVAWRSYRLLSTHQSHTGERVLVQWPIYLLQQITMNVEN